MGVSVFEGHDGADNVQPSQFGAALAVGNLSHRHHGVQTFGDGSTRLLQKPGNVSTSEILHPPVDFGLGRFDVLIGKNTGSLR